MLDTLSILLEAFLRWLDTSIVLLDTPRRWLDTLLISLDTSTKEQNTNKRSADPLRSALLLSTSNHNIVFITSMNRRFKLSAVCFLSVHDC